MEKKSFENWNFEEVEDVFGINRKRGMLLLKDWLAAKHEPDSVRTVILDEMRLYLTEYADTWQEDELKMCFIHRRRGGRGSRRLRAPSLYPGSATPCRAPGPRLLFCPSCRSSHVPRR